MKSDIKHFFVHETDLHLHTFKCIAESILINVCRDIFERSVTNINV